MTGKPRSAHIFAEERSVLYELSADNFQRLRAQNPALIQALMTYVISIMGERLSFASRTIGVMQQ